MVNRSDTLLKTIRLHHGNAWVVISMPNDKTISLSGEWHANWIDRQLTYDALLSNSWQELLGTETSIVNRTGASDTLNHWVEWMKNRHST